MQNCLRHFQGDSNKTFPSTSWLLLLSTYNNSRDFIKCKIQTVIGSRDFLWFSNRGLIHDLEEAALNISYESVTAVLPRNNMTNFHLECKGIKADCGTKNINFCIKCTILFMFTDCVANNQTPLSSSTPYSAFGLSFLLNFKHGAPICEVLERVAVELGDSKTTLAILA